MELYSKTGSVKACERHDISSILDNDTRYGTVNPYWHHVGLYYEQLEGLIAGYNLAARDTNLTIPAGDLYWMNVQGDIEDLEQVGLCQSSILDKLQPYLPMSNAGGTYVAYKM